MRYPHKEIIFHKVNISYKEMILHNILQNIILKKELVIVLDLVDHIHNQVMHNKYHMPNNLFLEDNNLLILLMNIV